MLEGNGNIGACFQESVDLGFDSFAIRALVVREDDDVDGGIGWTKGVAACEGGGGRCGC